MQTVDTDAGPVWPQPPQKPRIQFLKSISGPADMGIKKSWLRRTVDTLFGAQEGGATMLRPYSVFVDGDRIYVTDPGISALHIFNLPEKDYSLIRKFGEETLVSPIGVAADTDSIYLTDSVLKKVFVFDKEGRPQRVIGTPELFIRPTGIAVDDDRIYVVDTYGHRVFVFGKKEGNVLFHFGKNGQGHGEFHYPTNIFVGKDGLLYITDSLNFRIQIFDREGNFSQPSANMATLQVTFQNQRVSRLIPKDIFMLPMRISTIFRFLTVLAICFWFLEKQAVEKEKWSFRQVSLLTKWTGYMWQIHTISAFRYFNI